jgi:hypothetical protein
MTTPVLWRAEASLRKEHMVSALVTAYTVHSIHGSIPSETSLRGNQRLESPVRENRQANGAGHTFLKAAAIRSSCTGCRALPT